MIIRQLDITNKKDVNQWLAFPFELYRESKQWVPPLLGGARAQLDPGKHPFYEHSSAEFLVAEDDGKTLGRIALLHNTRYNQYMNERAGLFSMFEVVEDIEVAREISDVLSVGTKIRRKSF